jgi:hypothetical protein
MTRSAEFSDYDPAALPAAVAGYLDAGAEAGQRRMLADIFAWDATVTDEGSDHVGRDAIRGWLTTAGSGFTYTTTPTGQHRDDGPHWVVAVRLEGDFPGGVADLRYRFTMRGAQIAQLVIAP